MISIKVRAVATQEYLIRVVQPSAWIFYIFYFPITVAYTVNVLLNECLQRALWNEIFKQQPKASEILIFGARKYRLLHLATVEFC